MSNDTFGGFEQPQQNWSKLPHELIDWLPKFESKAELAVVLYILRHTWGYSEFEKPKPITTDEFENGRKDKDGNRLDNGVGMSPPAIRSGLKKAQAHGFIVTHVDDTDKGRIKKSYQIAMHSQTPEPPEKEKTVQPDRKEFSSGGQEVYHRTEKETLERKEKDSAPGGATVVITSRSENRNRDKILKPNFEANTKQERPRNPVFDAVAFEVFGIEGDVPKSIAGRIAKLTKLANEAFEAVFDERNPERTAKALAVWVKRDYRDKDLTPLSAPDQFGVRFMAFLQRYKTGDHTPDPLGKHTRVLNWDTAS